MTVAELIKELQPFDPNLDICVRTGNRSYIRTDIYFEPETVWTRNGGQEEVLMMSGTF